MVWACTNCGRAYDDPPADVCVVCGHGSVVPAESAERDPRDAYLDDVRRVLFDPSSLEHGLTSSGTIVDIAFRLVLVFSALFLLVVTVAVLL